MPTYYYETDDETGDGKYKSEMDLLTDILAIGDQEPPLTTNQFRAIFDMCKLSR